MAGPRLSGALWLVAGISSAFIALFLVEPLDLAIFITGANLAILLGLVILMRPTLKWLSWSNLLGVAWVVAFGYMIATSLELPIEQLLSVVWVFGFGVAAALVAYLRRPRSTAS